MKDVGFAQTIWDKESQEWRVMQGDRWVTDEDGKPLVFESFTFAYDHAAGLDRIAGLSC